MSDYRRWFVPGGGTLFFTLVTYRRRPFLAGPLARRCLREAFQVVRAKRPFEIPAIVLLPDHLHTLWTLPRGDADYSVRWRRIKEEFTQRFLGAGGVEPEQTASRCRRRERGVWQRRFWEHTIRDETDLERHFHYIHYNPVKHGLAKCPRDWPYSSFHRYVREHNYPPRIGAVLPLLSHASTIWARHPSRVRQAQRRRTASITSKRNGTSIMVRRRYA